MSGKTPSPPRNWSARLRAALVVLALLAICLVLARTVRYGPGLSPDSVTYVSVAENLWASRGFVRYDGSLYVHWPPLFPALLALLEGSGVGAVEGARWLNAALFGVTVYLSGGLFRLCLRSTALTVIGTLSIFSAPLLLSSGYVWSEPLFTVLVLSFVLVAARTASRPGRPGLAALAVLAALACLQRYAGVALIPVGALVILFLVRSLTPVRRAACAAVFALSALTPLALWLWRNYVLTGSLAGSRRPSPYTLMDNVRHTADVMTSWFLPGLIPLTGRVVALAAAAALIGAVLLLRRSGSGRSAAEWDAGADAPLAVAAGVLFVYLPFLVYTVTSSTGSPVYYRFLAPVYPLVLCLAFGLLEKAGARRGRSPVGGRARLSPVLIGLCALWLVYPLSRTALNVIEGVQKGAGGYNTVTWRSSRLVRWLQDHPLDGPVYSNAADVVYILGGNPEARYVPYRGLGFSHFVDTLPSERTAYLVWFDAVDRDYLYDLDELSAVLAIQENVRFADGAVYRIAPLERSG